MFFWLGFGDGEARWIDDGKVRTVRLGFGDGEAGFGDGEARFWRR